MQLQLNKPLYVRGGIRFHLDGHALSYPKKDISLYGVAGLPWHPLKPKDHFGNPVLCRIALTSDPDNEITTRAHITREQTDTAQFMGLHFLWEADQQATMEEAIRREGYLPTANKRKFPRIPFLESIQAFPLKATIYLKTAATRAEAHPIQFSIGNISPEGVMLSTENPDALELKPGSRVTIVFEPRGWFPHMIQVQAQVQRVLDDIQPTSGSLIRSLGLHFTKFEESHQAAFKELLKEILIKLQAPG